MSEENLFKENYRLVIDVGNTCVKAGIFKNRKHKDTIVSSELSIEFIKSICIKHKTIFSVILSSVREIAPEVLNFLKINFSFISFSDTTPVPIKNLYKTPYTLGKDRLAGVIAANFLYPDKNVLVIDAGTCITYDFINASGEYLGGSISPGFSMRFKALHNFTGKLPLVSLSNYSGLIGIDTETSMLSGVINGITAEADEIINKYKMLYKPIKTVICGGDAFFLAERLKNSIFALPELIMLGLNEILIYNEL